MLISRTCVFFFLPPKEAQGKVRQGQGRAAANKFALRAKTDLRVHRDPPLTTLSVKGYCRKSNRCQYHVTLYHFDTTVSFNRAHNHGHHEKVDSLHALPLD